MKLKLIVSAFLFLSSVSLYSKENTGTNNSNPVIPLVVGCNPSLSVSDLDIGNVRARIFINGDMWWDLVGYPKYEIPKGSGLCPLFAGAIWLGGKDGAANLKIAAQTYRQSGSDFWPGPVDTTNYTISAADCQTYDRHWKITRQEVAVFRNGGAASQVIKDWPIGNFSGNQAHFLAPFYDINGDGIYDWSQGDYPKYDFNNSIPDVNQRLNGDQTIWWVFNDVGNIHSETQSIGALGVEIRAQAYAFCSFDATLDNTTFYTYQVINRSSNLYSDFFIGQFTDTDLGNYLDDYVGCDVSRNLGYGYNGDSLDEGVTGYGLNLAAVGIDLLQGPIADPVDSIDNNHNGITDEPGETILMTKFIYYNNDTSVIGNPVSAQNHYNYLKGIWKDGSSLLFGDDGHSSSGPPCSYMYPGSSDPNNYGTNGTNPGFEWSESYPSLGGLPNAPGDRRFLMSSGPLTLTPGRVFYFTKAAVWARAVGGIDSSVQALKVADDKIQSFFDSNFNSIATCATAEINDLSSLQFSVYPSPAKDYFIISLPEIPQGLSIEIYSSDGKLVFESKEENSNEVKIITTNWSSGIYYFRLNDKNKSSAGKIVIQ